jgi:hypothetical protein
MQTRSQTRNQLRNQMNTFKEGVRSALFTVDINFDEASEAWRSNKKSTGNGCYKYICLAKTKMGKPCCRLSLVGEDYCKLHSKYSK